MMWTSGYYQGAIEAYDREIALAEKAGIIISSGRLNQFKMMLDDFRELEAKVKSFETQSDQKEMSNE